MLNNQMAKTSEKTLEYLREQIINGALSPQEKLVEESIAKTLGISRGPVRDALRQLAVEGLVDYQPNKGCTVARLSPKDAYELFFLRGSLEKLAIQKSGGVLDADALFLMEIAMDEFRSATESGSLMQSVRADEKFHRQIIQSAHIDRLTKMWELLSPLNGAMFLSIKNANHLFGVEPTPGSSVRPGDLVGAHQEILLAVKSRDPEAVCRQLDVHYEKNGERIYKLSILHDEQL